MKNKISFRKKLVTIGTSYGVIIERTLLSLIGIENKDLAKNIMLKITVETIDNDKQKGNLLAKLAGEKMKKDKVNQLTIKLKQHGNEDETKDETKEKSD